MRCPRLYGGHTRMIAPAAKLEPLVMPSREAAEVLAVSERTLSRITYPHGDLPCLRIGTGRRPLLRYRMSDLQAWIDRHTQGSEQEIDPQIVGNAHALDRSCHATPNGVSTK